MKLTHRCPFDRNPAVQRIVRPGIISFRCEQHKMSKREAKALNARVFDLTKEASR